MPDGITSQQVQSIFATLSGDAPQDFFRHVADDVSWDVLGTHPLAGHYSTKAAFQKATFDRLGSLFEEPLRLSVRQVLVDGDCAAVELEAHATARSGFDFHNRYCWICHFRSGQIIAVRAYLDSALVAALIEAGS